MRVRARRAAQDRRRAPARSGADACAVRRRLFHRIKTSFFQRFRVSRGKHRRVIATRDTGAAEISGRSGTAVNGSRIFFRRAVAFRRRTTPIARNCASPSASRDGDRRTSERRRRACSGDEPNDEPGATGCIHDARSMHAIGGATTLGRPPRRRSRRLAGDRRRHRRPTNGTMRATHPPPANEEAARVSADGFRMRQAWRDVAMRQCSSSSSSSA